jgi:serine/threonine protein kinase
VVGAGRTCQVWEGLNDITGQRVALKVLLPNYSRNREQVALMRHEYVVAKNFNHPRVIKVHAFNTTPKATYLAMEYYNSPNLKQLITQGVERIAWMLQRIVEQSAEALGYLHKQGWIHRDVKPDNFLCDPEGNIKLIDFALTARQSGWLGSFLGRSKIQGTRSYMSPEQIRGRRVDARADVYSLGCMMHELIAGRPPYTGVNADELLMKHLRAAPPPLEGVNRNVTAGFATLVRRMLAKHPNQRPNSMTDVIMELRSNRVFTNPPSPPE